MSTQDTERPADRLLIIDDDVELCALVTEYLAPEGFQVESVHDAEQGINRALSKEHALVVLDVLLPGLNGFEVLRRIRGHSNIPVIMLTARGDDVDRIVGLEIGADDYLPKPFNPRELVARINAILRRASEASAARAVHSRNQMLAVGDVELELGARIARRGGRPIELTAAEFDLLKMLLQEAGQVIERQRISQVVFGRKLVPYDRGIDMHISNLRKKLGHTVGDMERIKTIRGVGYVYAVSGNPAPKDNATDKH